MFRTVRQINEMTDIVTDGQTEFVAKKIFPEDMGIYETLARLQNTPYIAKIYGVFVIDDALCAVREYVEGVTVEDYIEKHGPFDERRVKLFAEDICRGLAVIHSAGIVHRDINPSNIIINPAGIAVIIDFGISRTVKPGKSADTAVLGTQGYAAPEQFGFKQTDKKTDIYAVGVLINYMLTACLPNEKTAAGHFGNIVRKCTKPDPSDRYRCAQEIIYALNHPVLGVNIFCYIPGFRSGKIWHGVIATVYYLFLVLLVLVLSVGEDNKMSFPVFLFILLDFIAPVLILTDFLDWSSRFKFTVFMKKSRLIALKIALTVLCAAPIPVVAFCRELFK